MPVSDDRRGMDQLRRRLASLHSQTVTVGVHGDEAKRKDGDGGGISNVRLAAVHEFGATIDMVSARGEDGQGYVVRKRVKDSKTSIHLAKAHKIVIPQRSFIRGTIDAHRADIGSAMSALTTQVVTGNVLPKSAAARLGALVVGLIKQRMARGIGPALAPSTLRRKQRKSAVGRRMQKRGMAGPANVKPLIDTGQLRQSVTYEVK